MKILCKDKVIFEGSYHAFNMFRQAICKTLGGSFPPHANTKKFPEPDLWYHNTSEKVVKSFRPLLESDDCCGEIPADKLRSLSLAIKKRYFEIVREWERLYSGKTYRVAFEKHEKSLCLSRVSSFISGCEYASKNKIPIEIIGE